MVTIITDSKGFLPFDHPRNYIYRSMNLLTPEQIQTLPSGTRLHCSNGMSVVVGQDHIDLDVRAGFTAFGFYAERPGQTFYQAVSVRLVLISKSGARYEVDYDFGQLDHMHGETMLVARVREAIRKATKHEYDPAYGENRLCTCGHIYYRHFDTYDHMRPVGCKYCGFECTGFKEKQP